MSLPFYNVVDVETTGFDAWKHDVVSMCSIVLDSDLNEVARFTDTCKPLEMQYLIDTKANDASRIRYIESIQGALDINGYKPQDLSQMQSTKDMLIKYHNHIKGFRSGSNYPVFVQHAFIKGDRVGFDWSFVFATHFKTDRRSYFYRSHKDGLSLSTVTIAKKELKSLKNHKLDTLCEHFDIQLEHHDAESDTQATAELLRRFKEINPDSIRA